MIRLLCATSGDAAVFTVIPPGNGERTPFISHDTEAIAHRLQQLGVKAPRNLIEHARRYGEVDIKPDR